MSVSFREKLATCAIAHLRSIIKDNNERIEQAKDPNLAEKALQAGVWYGEDYALAAKKLEGRVSIPKACLNDFALGYAPENFFEQKGNLRFITKSGVSASDALDAAIVGPLIGDCGIAIQLAFHKAIRDVLGKSLYDITFKDKLVLGYCGGDDQLMMTFVTKVKKSPSPSNPEKMIFAVAKGCITSFHNDPRYLSKHPRGRAGTYNLLYAGGGKYLGLGTPTEGLNAQELRSLYVSEFNKPGLTQEQTTAEKIVGFVNRLAKFDYEGIEKLASLKDLLPL